MIADPKSVTLAGFSVQQRDIRFFSAVIPAGKLSMLCEGLSKPTTLESESSLRDVELSAEDAAKLIKGLNEPEFAREVGDLQTEAYDEEQPFQRLLDRTRVQAIANYLRQEEAMLPNGVILATRDDVEIAVSEQDGGLVKLAITWTGDQHPFNIIDGQHRIEALKLLSNEDPAGFGEFATTATILVDLPFWMQAELFAVVNGRQKAVPKSRVYDLLGYHPMNSDEVKQGAYRGEMAVQRFCHHAVKVLQRSERSPWKSRIKMRGSGIGVVSQAAFVDHLAPYLKPRKERPGAVWWPVLFPLYREADIVGLAKALIIYFAGIRRAHEEFWQTEEALKGCLFGKTNGVAVAFAILHDQIVEAGGAENLTIDGVSERWRKVDRATVAAPPKGGSKGYQSLLVGEIRGQMQLGGAAGILQPSEDYLRRLRTIGALI